MRFVAILTLLAALGAATPGCSGGDGPASELNAAIALMKLPLGEFVDEALRDGRDGRFDWSTDLCSGPAAFSLWDDEFADACRRHDFGYRNFGAGGGLETTEERREWVDEIFAADMAAVCEDQPPALRMPCAADAELFWSAVRLTPFGQSAFFD